MIGEANGLFISQFKYLGFHGGPLVFKMVGASLGLLTTPFFVAGDTPSVAPAIMGVVTGLGAANPVANTTYLVNSDIVVNISGGAGISITIYDNYGHVITSDNYGHVITFGDFSDAPTVVVVHVSG